MSSAKNNKFEIEICQTMSDLLNISPKIIAKNINLFTNIDSYTANSLYYLSKIKNDQDKINAVHSLEFVYHFHKRIDRYLFGDDKKSFTKICKKQKSKIKLKDIHKASTFE